MKWYWRVTIIVCLIIVGTFAVTMLEINSNWGYLFGFMIFLIDILIDKYHPKITSFLKAIWGNIWPTVKQNKPSPESVAWHHSYAKKVLSGEIPTKDWREENKKLMENYKGFFAPEFYTDQFLRECRDIPDDKELSKYVMCIDPTNGSFRFVNLHGEPITNPSPFLKEQLRIAKEKQLAYFKALYYELCELSGDVSEQSVILPKMDEIYEHN